MNAIKTKEQQNNNAMKYLSTSTTINGRRRHTCTGTAVTTSEVDVYSWKQNAASSQVYKQTIILHDFF